MNAYFHRLQRHHWNGSKECSPSHCTHTPPASPLYRCIAHCPTRSDQLPPQTEQNQELKWHLYTENNFGHTLLSISASPKSWPGYIVITTTINTDVASFPVLIPQLLFLAVWFIALLAYTASDNSCTVVKDREQGYHGPSLLSLGMIYSTTCIYCKWQ